MLYVFMNYDTKYCISGAKLITNHSVCQEFFYFFYQSLLQPHTHASSFPRPHIHIR
jgi:hypothetical protein